MHGNSHIYLKRQNFSFKFENQVPSLPYVQPHNESKSLATRSHLPPTRATNWVWQAGENKNSYLPGTAVLMPKLKMVITNGVFQGQKTYMSKAAEYFLASLKPLFQNNL